MDWHLTILVLLIFVTFLAWRRARRENELARARAAALEGARWIYRLEPAETAAGRGYSVLTGDGAPLHAPALSWEDDGILILPVAGTERHREELQEPAFEAGSRIQLVADDDADADPADGAAGAAAVGVLDNGGTLRIGYIPRDVASPTRARLATGELSDCIVLWESRRGDERTGVVLLLVHADAVVEG
jgi:hypothetical protein